MHREEDPEKTARDARQLAAKKRAAGENDQAAVLEGLATEQEAKLLFSLTDDQQSLRVTVIGAAGAPAENDLCDILLKDDVAQVLPEDSAALHLVEMHGSVQL